MIPSALASLALALAALRCWQLAARDTLPPVVRLRSLAVGSHVAPDGGHWFDRPRLAEWLQCPWCSGLWWSAGWYGAWLAEPRWALYAAAPLALSAAVGIAASLLPE